jgi:hypothetical protein
MDLKKVTTVLIFGAVSGFLMLGIVFGNPPENGAGGDDTQQDESGDAQPETEKKEYWRTLLAEDPTLDALALCESSRNPMAVNPMDADGTPSYGLFQYKWATWEMFTRDMGFTDDLFNPYDQITVTKWAIAHGLENHWGCWPKISH